jgi:formylglycine-generating enzyme required for sulfatase activity
VSGYSACPQEFRDLLRILDGEVRLITPTDPAGDDGGDREETAAPRGKYYQLTHDYLVPSLREWLTRKQKETRRGRAELRLAERAALWNDKPENRFLPSAWEWFRIRLLTRKKDWNEPQRRMMKRAGRVHQSRSLGLALLIALLTWGAIEGYGSLRASSMVEALASAETSDMPRLVERLTGYRRWANPRLVRLAQASKDDSKVRLHASLALVPVDPSQTDYLARRILTASPTELPVIWRILTAHHPAPVKRFWEVLDDPKADPDQRLRAACVLANDHAVGTETRWDAVAPFVTDRLIASIHKNPNHYAPLIEMLRPVRQPLLAPLSATFRNKKREEYERSLATSILADYASDQPTVLADLLMDSGKNSFAILFDKLKAHREEAVALLEAERAKPRATETSADAKDKRDRRQGRAAVALLRLGHPETAWTLLKHSRDPGVRSEIINGLKPLGAEFETIAAKLASMGTTAEESPVGDPSRMRTILFDHETSMRRALILALGQYEVDTLSSREREPLVAKLVEAYRDDPDAGIHGAAEWTLRRWKQDKKLKAVDAELMKLKDRGDHRWCMNSQGQTFALIDGPVEFSMGSPPTDPERFGDERPHRGRVPRRFVIAAREVTVDQYEAFVKENPGVDHATHDRYSPDPDGPMNMVSWYHAAAYCNWLSRKEGLPECYEPNEQGEYAEGMRIKADAWKLSGYRLPTEAEWEYACRAGAETNRYYGASVELLGSYCAYAANSQDRIRPCGSLLPNDLGLFDMLGNVYEWCQDPYGPYPQGPEDDKTDNINKCSLIIDKDQRVLRGGAFFYPAGTVRSPNRYKIVPSYHDFDSGFRPARTYP